MEKIAFISGGTFICWSSIILALAVVTAVALYMAFYLARGGKATGMSVAVPVAMALALILGRLVHWYSRTDSYASFSDAMGLFSPGGYALLGAFAGCLITACLLRLVRLIPSIPAMLDAMAFGGCAGIAVGRLASLFNTSDRGVAVADSVGFPFAYPVVNQVSGLAENRLATFMIQSMLAAAILICLLFFLTVQGLRKRKVRRGDVCLLFLLAYGASQIVCDSTRYDSLYLRSNGFISIVQIMGLIGMLVPMIIFSVRMVKARRLRFWQMIIWAVMLAGLGCAGYMEYYVQRHGDQAAFAYSVMSAALGVVVLLVLLVRALSQKRRLLTERDLGQ
jgi:prolipoprotein diacylglyceryltransferase